MESVHQEKKNIYSRYLQNAVINEHLFRIIELISREYIIGLVTTASRKNAMEILNYFSVQDKFEIIVTQEDVTHVKPSPECFFLAMNLCKISAKNTIIFEDSDVGLQAAKESGAQYYKVYGYN